MKFKIDKDVKIALSVSSRTSQYRELIADMEEGDSVGELAQNQANALAQLMRKKGLNAIARKITESKVDEKEPVDRVWQDGDWDKETYLGHGLGMMWRKTLAHSSLWSIDNALLHTGAKLEVEVVRIESGLFTGSRDTEPHMAMVAQFNIKCQDFFMINVHRTTFKGEV